MPATALALAGCSQAGVYAGQREGQRQQCPQQPEAREREQCLQDAGESDRDYRRRREAASH